MHARSMIGAQRERHDEATDSHEATPQPRRTAEERRPHDDREQHVSRDDTRRRRHADFLRRYEQGIEPHPGPPVRPRTRSTHTLGDLACPDGHPVRENTMRAACTHYSEDKKRYKCEVCDRWFEQTRHELVRTAGRARDQQWCTAPRTRNERRTARAEDTQTAGARRDHANAYPTRPPDTLPGPLVPPAIPPSTFRYVVVGAHPGETVQVVAPSGNLVRFTIPQNSYFGKELLITDPGRAQRQTPTAPKPPDTTQRHTPAQTVAAEQRPTFKCVVTAPPGHRMHVTAPNGNTVTIVVPPQVTMGSEIVVREPAPPHRPTRSTPTPPLLATPTPQQPLIRSPNAPPTPSPQAQTGNLQPKFQSCAGDIEASGQNCRGLNRIDVCTEHVARAMARSHIHFMLETNHDEMTHTIMRYKVKKGKQYTLYGNPTRTGGTVGKGVAVLVADSIISAPSDRAPSEDDNEIIYTDDGGKVLAVHLYVRGRPIIAIAMHLPHTDIDRSNFLDKHGTAINEAIETKMAKQGYTTRPSIIRFADDNFVRCPSQDCSPPGHDIQTEAHRAMARMQKRLAPCGMLDAYRHTDPDGRAMTYTHPARGGQPGTSRRYDVFDVSSDLASGAGITIARTRHRTPQDTMVVYAAADGTRHAKRSDHSEVSITLRYTDIPRPPREPTIPQEILESGAADAEVKQALTAAASVEVAPEHADAHAREWQAQVMQIFQRHEKRQRNEEYRKLAEARRRLNDAQRLLDGTAHDVAPRTLKDRQQKVARMQARLASLYDARQRRVAVRRGTMAATSASDERLTAAPKATTHAPVLAAHRATGSGDNVGLHTTQQGIHETIDEFWKEYLNQPWDPVATAERAEVLCAIKRDPTLRLPPSAAAALTIASVLHKDNLKEAIASLKRHTTPGVDGEPSELYQRYTDEMIPLLQDLYRNLMQRGSMTESMRTGVLTPLFKGKGSRTDPAGYRPITVTTTQYKILARAIAQRVGEVVHHVVKDSQIGFQALKRIAENIDLAVETISYVNEPGMGREGVFVL